jgi:hypothetical protein
MTLFAEIPALPLHTAGPYVAAAYVVFVVVLLVYLAIMALRLVRSQRELAELKRQILERQPVAAESLPDPVGSPADAELRDPDDVLQKR